MSPVHIGLPILQMVVKGDWTVKQTGKDNSILVNKNQTGQAPLITDRFSISFPSFIGCNFWTNHVKSQQKSSDQFKVLFKYPNEGFTLASPRNILFSLQILVNKNQTGQAPLITDRYGDIWEVCVCLSLLPCGRDQPFLGITGVIFFQTELKPVRRVSADAHLKRFQHKVIQARRKPTLNMGEFRVAQPIALRLNHCVSVETELFFLVSWHSARMWVGPV